MWVKNLLLARSKFKKIELLSALSLFLVSPLCLSLLLNSHWKDWRNHKGTCKGHYCFVLGCALPCERADMTRTQAAPSCRESKTLHVVCGTVHYIPNAHPNHSLSSGFLMNKVPPVYLLIQVQQRFTRNGK